MDPSVSMFLLVVGLGLLGIVVLLLLGYALIGILWLFQWLFFNDDGTPMRNWPFQM